MASAMERSSTVQAVLQTMRREIICGYLKNKTPVTEITFSQKYGCSRAALRGALSVLEQEGLIFVNPNGTKQISSLTCEDIDNLYALRIYIETTAVKQILKNNLEFDKLIPIMEYSKTDLSSGFLDTDMMFHETLVLLSKNKALIRTWHVFSAVIREIFNLNLSEEKNQDNFFTNRHETIVRLLINKDKAVIKELEMHINEAHRLSIKNVKSQIRRNAK